MSAPKRYKAFLEPESSENIPRRTQYRMRIPEQAGSQDSGESSEITNGASSGSGGIPLPTRNGDGDCLVDGTDVEGIQHPVGERMDHEAAGDAGRPSQDDVPNQESSDGSGDGSSDDSTLTSDEDDADEWHDADDMDYDFVLDGEEDMKLTCRGVVTRKEAILLLLVFFQRHGLSLRALGDLAGMINALFGYQAVPGSLHKLRKIWNKFSTSSKVHFFCASCSVLLKSVSTGDRTMKRLWCSDCKVWCSSMVGKGSNYFITMSIKAQLKRILEKFGRYISFSRDSSSNLTDIGDGRMMKRLAGSSATSKFLSLLFSTDGSPAFNSGVMSLWPITAFLNELAPKIRFGLPIVAGLWCSSSPVFMSLFFSVFIAEMRQLQSEGLRWLFGGQWITCKVYAVCSVPDTVARSSIQNFVRFNGNFGCSWCYHPGQYEAHQVRYPILDRYEKRTDVSTRRDAERAYVTGKNVKGVKGPSCLFNLPQFNLVEGLVPDYMHCVCLGVAKMLMEMWVCTKNHAKDFYIGRRSQLATVNQRITGIRPPGEITRMPRSLKHRGDWKASEWRSWVLFYGVPCLKDVLHPRYLSHFALFSSSVFILLQDSISPNDLRTADDGLFEFVVKFQLLYGVSSMTSNVHQLVHLARSVRNWGPLWAHSAFPFEDWNGRLLKFVHGTQSVSHQVMQRLSISMVIESLLEKEEMCASTVAYCRDALGRARLGNYEKSGDGLTTGLGVGRTEELSLPERVAIERTIPAFEAVGTCYQRVVHNGSVLTPVSRVTKQCDAYVVIDGDRYLQVRKLVLVSCNGVKRFILLGNPCVQCGGDDFQDLPAHLKVVRVDEELVAVPSTLVRSKCVVVHLDNVTFIAGLPSRFLGN